MSNSSNNNEYEGNNQFRVPSYAIVSGRTYDTKSLALETMVSLVVGRTTTLLNYEKKQIVEIASKPISIAEISAYLALPLQVAKILVGDLIASGFLKSGKAMKTVNDRPDKQTLNKVLEGLKGLSDIDE